MRNRHQIDTTAIQRAQGGLLMENTIFTGNVKLPESEFPKLSAAAKAASNPFHPSSSAFNLSQVSEQSQIRANFLCM